MVWSGIGGRRRLRRKIKYLQALRRDLKGCFQRCEKPYYFREVTCHQKLRNGSEIGKVVKILARVTARGRFWFLFGSTRDSSHIGPGEPHLLKSGFLTFQRFHLLCLYDEPVWAAGQLEVFILNVRLYIKLLMFMQKFNLTLNLQR